MKFALASDVHLEFGQLNLRNTENADLLILAGDICVASDFSIPTKVAERYRDFFDQVSSEFNHVIYIMGNHEHYHGDFAKTESIIREEMQFFNNIKFLEKQHFDLCGVRFIGGTMWTDANKNDSVTKIVLKKNMNDYQTVKNSNRLVSYKVPVYSNIPEDDSSGTEHRVMVYKQKVGKLSVEDTMEDHGKFMRYLTETIDKTENMPIVVISHHLPLHQSIPERYVADFHTNGGYASDLTNYILDRNSKIKYWIHGHTHDPSDYMIGTTRILCNPRGYIDYESCADYFTTNYYTLET